jgi:hypothetical protein
LENHNDALQQELLSTKELMRDQEALILQFTDVQEEAD